MDRSNERTDEQTGRTGQHSSELPGMDMTQYNTTCMIIMSNFAVAWAQSKHSLHFNKRQDFLAFWVDELKQLQVHEALIKG